MYNNLSFGDHLDLLMMSKTIGSPAFPYQVVWVINNGAK